MKIGLISDVHGNAPALRKVLEALLPRVERVFFLGDMAGYYPFVNECMELWDEKKMSGVRGNHDEVLIRCLKSGSQPDEDYRSRFGSAVQRCLPTLSERARKIIVSWPEELEVQLGSVRLRLFHGAPWDPLEGRVYPDFDSWERFRGLSADFILMGHTHYPFARREGTATLVNPGSVGQPRDGIHDASYALLDTETREVTLLRVPYDASTVLEDARRHDPGLPYLTKVLSQ